MVFANPYASRSQHISSPKIAQLRLKGSVSGSEFKPALARLDMHSWRDLIECCARSFYAMGQESQVWARGSIDKESGRDTWIKENSMETDKFSAKHSDADQLKKYANDLVKIYKSEKQKRKELEAANLQLIKYGHDLNKTVSELKVANLELRKAYLDTIYRLVIAAEYRDEDTGDHIIRIGRYSALIAEKLGMPDINPKDMLYAAPMHDIGKIGIPDHILLKPDRLTDEEFDIVKTHTAIGGKILSNSNAKIIMLAEQIALSHHEQWNGQGYPNGLSGKDIPLIGRIVAVADVFDALISKRSHKKANR